MTLSGRVAQPLFGLARPVQDTRRSRAKRQGRSIEPVCRRLAAFRGEQLELYGAVRVARYQHFSRA
jgi:hypothetical protein